MANKKQKIPTTPLTGSEEIPPGARREAFDRPEDPGGGPPGSGAGDRHAAEEPAGGSLFDGIADNPDVDPTIPREEEDEAGYGGPSGGAVGGTPAGLRSTGGQVRHGFDPGGSKRGDSTIGADPDQGS